ncbi:ABC transporter ATP-binding protein/permease [Tissierella carlieri]|uniref:ABC transporter ATP-binding protein/permease n=1 Tax=Tissierella carlieri TaxID=689904 RepID=A0ABT1SH85_9FIRM|nr:ABC transporter ATP-binding protein [Tissierella carlieri]MCQ4925635.1 ABC transporter ATP-binding protein/permease [Tissierella carlieri]
MFRKRLRLSVKLKKTDILLQIIILLTSYGIKLVFPYIFKYILDNINKIGIGDIPRYILIIVGFSLVAHTYIYLASYWNQKYCNRITSQYMDDIVTKISRINIPDYEKMSKSKILNLLNYDISVIYTWININISIPFNFIQVIVIGGILLSINKTMAFISFVLIPIYYLGSYSNKNKMESLAREEREYADLLMDQIQDVVYKKTSIDLFSAWRFFRKKFNSVKGEWWDIVNRKHLYLLLTKEFPQLVSTITPFIILLLGANLVYKKDMTLGTLVMFIQYVAMIYSPLTELSNLRANVNSDIAAFERINEFLGYENRDSDYESFFKLNANPLNIKNSQVTTDDGTLLFNIENMNISENGLYIIRGDNGTGKTTLFNLISGVYFSEQIKGKRSDFEMKKEIMGNISYLYNPSILFNGTIEENIFLTDSEKDSQKIDKMEEMIDFFNAKDKNYCVKINPSNLSLGEQQKVFIIRTFLKSSSFVLLDEPSANLDYESKYLLRDFLNMEKKNRVILLISHDGIYEEIADEIYEIQNQNLRAVNKRKQNKQ